MLFRSRPEYLEDAAIQETPTGRRLRGKVELREALGSELMVHFAVEGVRPALTEDVKELARDVGETAEEREPEGGAHFVGRFSARSKIQEAEPVEVAVDTTYLHFFDPESGLGIYDGQATKGAAS